VSGAPVQKPSSFTKSPEFTGERVVPGAVNDDLWADHISRYAFAARFATATRALDLGCGTGYGAREIALRARHVVGIDVANDAVKYAHENFGAPNTTFVQASATTLPFASASFDLITAFEVIEHLSDWKSLLAEARRVLAPAGVVIISTPNKLYYAESRMLDGPNPYHEHEFEYEEFRTALEEFFPHVAMLVQNRLESVAFYPEAQLPLDTRMDKLQGSPLDANFFVAVCSLGQPAVTRSFLYIPRAANVLREREHHIKLLETDLRRLIDEHKELAQKHTDLTAHLEEQNRWATDLELLWKQAQARVVELQEEFAAEQKRGQEVADAYAKKVAEVEAENLEKTKWALETERRLGNDLVVQSGQLAETLRRLEETEATMEERTKWAQSLEEQIRDLEHQLAMVRASRWVKLGRSIGLGPKP
jgi:ubiquinone/menaquinone biosynthesis C-methylase UbiE